MKRIRPADLQKSLKNVGNAFSRLGWRVYKLLIINLSRKKVLLVLILLNEVPYGIPKVYKNIKIPMISVIIEKEKKNK